MSHLNPFIIKSVCGRMQVFIPSTQIPEFYLLALSSLIKQAQISKISSCDTKVSLFGLQFNYDPL